MCEVLISCIFETLPASPPSISASCHEEPAGGGTSVYPLLPCLVCRVADQERERRCLPYRSTSQKRGLLSCSCLLLVLHRRNTIPGSSGASSANGCLRRAHPSSPPSRLALSLSLSGNFQEFSCNHKPQRGRSVNLTCGLLSSTFHTTISDSSTSTQLSRKLHRCFTVDCLMDDK